MVVVLVVVLVLVLVVVLVVVMQCNVLGLFGCNHIDPRLLTYLSDCLHLRLNIFLLTF